MKTVSVSANSAGGYMVEVYARQHLMIVDQTPPMGGKDEGPSPLEYLFASLASCLVTVGMIISKQERLDVKNIDVKLEGDIDVDVLLGKSKEYRPGFVGLRLVVDVDSDKMTHEEKVAFIEKVESRCPISDNLINTTPVSLEVL